jgi:molybdate transport system substrate-binding protein
MRFSVTLWAMVLLLTAHVSLARADQIRVAVASNFYATAKLIAHEFEKQTAHTVQLSAGSTGKHFAQIIHGAPYD